MKPPSGVSHLFWARLWGGPSIFSLPKFSPGLIRGGLQESGVGGVKWHPTPTRSCPGLQARAVCNWRQRSPARSPRAGGARSAAATRANSSHSAGPGPGGASRPVAPALGANCQGSKAWVRRAPRGHRRGRAPELWASSSVWAGTPRTLGHPRKSSLSLHSSLHIR